MVKKCNKGTISLIAFFILVLLGLLVCHAPLLARFGNPAMRLVVLCEWTNQKRHLDPLQKRVALSLLYQDVNDPDAPSEAMTVLHAHLGEDEDEIVRHLSYLALTTKVTLTREAALSGLRFVSAQNKEAAVAAFLHVLNHADPEQQANARSLSICIAGLRKYSYLEALPRIKQLTTNQSGYLAFTAKEAVANMEKLEQVPLAPE